MKMNTISLPWLARPKTKPPPPLAFSLAQPKKRRVLISKQKQGQKPTTTTYGVFRCLGFWARSLFLRLLQRRQDLLAPKKFRSEIWFWGERGRMRDWLCVWASTEIWLVELQEFGGVGFMILGQEFWRGGGGVKSTWEVDGVVCWEGGGLYALVQVVFLVNWKLGLLKSVLGCEGERERERERERDLTSRRGEPVLCRNNQKRVESPVDGVTAPYLLGASCWMSV
jgi:hypothetical protein